MEKLPVQLRNQKIKAIFLSCPALRGRSLQLEDCRDCQYHGGILARPFIKYPDGKLFELPADAKKTNCSPLEDVESGMAEMVTIPTQVVCNYPTLVGLGYVWEAK